MTDGNKHDHGHDHKHDHDHHHHDHDHDHDHDHHHGHGHDHHHHHGLGGHHHDLRDASKKSLIWSLILIGSFMFVEVIGGILSGSLALIADAGHMLTDAASIGFALVALHFSTLPASAERTFGYHRLEILAALLNALTLWLISAWVILEAYHRFRSVPDVDGTIMFYVGVVGLLVNLIAAWILHKQSGHSLNVEGAFQHVMADLLGSVAVVISAILVWAFGWTLADPILSVVIGVLILMSTWRLLGKVIHVLLQGVPEHIDVYKLCSDMEHVEGVVLIHDIHVWNLAPNYDVLTAHIIYDPAFDVEQVNATQEQLRDIATKEYGVQHVTLQLESSPEGCVEETHHVDHLHARAGSEVQRESLFKRARSVLTNG